MLSVALGQAQKVWRSGKRAARSIIRAPLEQRAKNLREEAIRRGGKRIVMPEETCSALFDANTLAATPGTLDRLGQMAAEWSKDADRTRDEKKFPFNLLQSEDLFAHRELIDIAVHDDIIAAITGYMGQVPRLYNLTVWWTPPNDTVERSQLYHYDHRDSKQAKVFINLNNVTAESGPLHYIPADDCLKVNAKVGYSQGRYSDEDVYSAVPESCVIATTGAPGAGFIVDTARCLHYGSRGNKFDRLILMASFARVNSVSPGPGCRVLDPIRKRLADEFYVTDPVKSLVLNTPR